MAYLSHFLWNNRIEWAQVVRSNFLKLFSAKISLASILVRDSSNSVFSFLRILIKRSWSTCERLCRIIRTSPVFQQKSRLAANL